MCKFACGLFVPIRSHPAHAVARDAEKPSSWTLRGRRLLTDASGPKPSSRLPPTLWPTYPLSRARPDRQRCPEQVRSAHTSAAAHDASSLCQSAGSSRARKSRPIPRRLLLASACPSSCAPSTFVGRECERTVRQKGLCSFGFCWTREARLSSTHAKHHILKLPSSPLIAQPPNASRQAQALDLQLRGG